jgi:hypothetical protein
MNDSVGSARLAIVLSIVVAAAVATAIVIINPPAQRRGRVDERRIEELGQIRDDIDLYWKRHQAIPRDLPALAGEPGFTTPTLDPETAVPYSYEIKDADSYRLCASFALDSGDAKYRQYRSYANEWAHPAGRFCFDFDVRKPETEERN